MTDTTAPNRPHNPWIPLSLLGLAGLALAFLFGSCVLMFVSSVPTRSLEAPLDDLTVGVPRFYPQTGFGSDKDGQTFGVWILRRGTEGVLALHSRDPHSSCHVQWRSSESVSGHASVFRGTCDPSAYTTEGEAISGPTQRDLDRFEVSISETSVTVDIERIRLGTCRAMINEAIDCSPIGTPMYRDVPSAPVTSSYDP